MGTKIQWTEETINPTMGCNIVSSECDNCYAMYMAHRLESMGVKGYEGTTRKLESGRIVWTGKINFDIEKLKQAVKRKKPTMFFVDSMSDLFHKDVPFEFIENVFDIMADNKQHIFQVLTKRIDRALEFFKWHGNNIKEAGLDSIPSQSPNLLDYIEIPKNIWLGVSAGTQKTADERIPILLQIPAAVRWVSAEPLLEEIDIKKHLPNTTIKGAKSGKDGYGNRVIISCGICNKLLLDADPGNNAGRNWLNMELEKSIYPKHYSQCGVNWVVAGAESGHGKRTCKQEWIESIVNQCKGANVPVFVKQLQINNQVIKDINEFPKSLQVREYPGKVE
jgi:protein gp37